MHDLKQFQPSCLATEACHLVQVFSSNGGIPPISGLAKHSSKVGQDVVATRVCQMVEKVGNRVLVSEDSLSAKAKYSNPANFPYI